MNKRFLFLIPARKNSIRLKDKNIKTLSGKPLIYHTLDYANLVAEESDLICVTSNDPIIRDLTIKNFPHFEFINRPDSLSDDFISMEEVIRHSHEIIKKKGYFFQAIILLQPTSPLREKADYINLIEAFDKSIDLVVSVRESRENPYYFLYEETPNGYLKKSKESSYQRSQDTPKVYCLNGAFFMYNIDSIEKKPFSHFTKIKLIMPFERSIDIDDNIDWELIEFFMKKNE